MKKLTLIVTLLAVFFLSGCAPTLPPKADVQDSYSIDEIKSFSSVLDCQYAQSSAIRVDFVRDYCQVLEGSIKVALKREYRKLKYDEANPDVIVHTTLEEIHGGNAAARFWIGFGAGRSITTVYVKVMKNEEILAERRITETTTMPNIATNNYENEDAILQDAPLVANKVVLFVKDPQNFDRNIHPE